MNRLEQLIVSMDWNNGQSTEWKNNQNKQCNDGALYTHTHFKSTEFINCIGLRASIDKWKHTRKSRPLFTNVSFMKILCVAVVVVFVVLEPLADTIVSSDLIINFLFQSNVRAQRRQRVTRPQQQAVLRSHCHCITIRFILENEHLIISTPVEHSETIINTKFCVFNAYRRMSIRMCSNQQPPFAY